MTLKEIIIRPEGRRLEFKEKMPTSASFLWLRNKTPPCDYIRVTGWGLVGDYIVAIRLSDV